MGLGLGSSRRPRAMTGISLHTAAQHAECSRLRIPAKLPH
jgi:hypothetical protein